MVLSSTIESFAQWSGPHFNFRIRCYDTHLSTDERVNYCRQAIGAEGWYLSILPLRSILISLYLSKGDHGNALAEANRAVSQLNRSEYAPDARALVLEDRSIVYAEMGHYDEALLDADAAMKLIQDWQAYRNRCRIRAIADRDLDLALIDCNQSLKSKPEKAQILDTRALVNLKRGDLQNALTDYQHALSSDSKLASSLYGRGVIEKELGQTQQGDADIKSAQVIDAGIAAEMQGYGVKP